MNTMAITTIKNTYARYLTKEIIKILQNMSLMTPLSCMHGQITRSQLLLSITVFQRGLGQQAKMKPSALIILMPKGLNKFLVQKHFSSLP